MAARITTQSGDESWSVVKALQDVVYTPDVLANIVWRDVESSYAEQRILLFDDDALISVVGLYPRDALLNNQSIRVTGIGGVMTHPKQRASGHGSRAMNHAREVITQKGDAAFAVLFCEHHNVAFYESLGWTIYSGDVTTEQRSKQIKYDIMHTMMLPISSDIPNGGTFNTNGLPW